MLETFELSTVLGYIGIIMSIVGGIIVIAKKLGTPTKIANKAKDMAEDAMAKAISVEEEIIEIKEELVRERDYSHKTHNRIFDKLDELRDIMRKSK